MSYDGKCTTIVHCYTFTNQVAVIIPLIDLDITICMKPGDLEFSNNPIESIGHASFVKVNCYNYNCSLQLKGPS